MEIIEFIETYLSPYTVKGDEIVATYCPFCGGGEHQDKNTFSLNYEKGVFCCMRGKCGVKGNISELAKYFKSDSPSAQKMSDIFSRKTKKVYSPVYTKILPMTEELYQYFELRKLTRETVDYFKIGSNKDGKAVFPFYENGKLVYVKKRVPRKVPKGGIKEDQDTGTRPILFGMDMCSFNQPLLITEGMIDCLSCYQAGFHNVVSIPCGTKNEEWIEQCWDWLDKFDEIILFGDNDEAGVKFNDSVSRRLGLARCSLINDFPTWPDNPSRMCNDANEILYLHGPEMLMQVINGAEAIPIRGIIDLADTPSIDYDNMMRIHTGIPSLDSITNGLAQGEVSVWTGRSGHGKSTFVSQCLLNGVEEGYNVCVYTGELQVQVFQKWLELQAAGSEYVGLRYDSFRKKEIPAISREVEKRIREWYKGHIFVFDNNEVFEDKMLDSVLEVFEVAARKFGVKLFLADNLMTITADEEDENSAQKKTAVKMKNFASRYNAHVMLVAHPRKTKAETFGLDDVAGSSKVPNMGDLLIMVNKPDLKIIKNRGDGITKSIACAYCGASRRIYEADVGDTFNFSWDKQGIEIPKKKASSLPEYGISLAEVPYSQPF